MTEAYAVFPQYNDFANLRELDVRCVTFELNEGQ
jgi:hypothetical protein